MRTYILKISAIICSFLLIVTAVSIPSCTQPGSCTGNITVYDSTGLPLANAAVTLYHPGDTSKAWLSAPGNFVYGPSLTNSKGAVQFVIKLPAEYTVRVQYPANPNRYVLGYIVLMTAGTTAAVTLQFQ